MTLPVTVAILPLCTWSLHCIMDAFFFVESHCWFEISVHRMYVRIEILEMFSFCCAVILACNRSEAYFYVYYVAKIVAGIFCEGSMHCLSLAYVVIIA